MLDPRFSESAAWARITTAASAAERLCGVLDPPELIAAILALAVPAHAELAIVELLPTSGLPLPPAIVHPRPDAIEKVRTALLRRRGEGRVETALRLSGAAGAHTLATASLPIDDPLRALARELRLDEITVAPIRAGDEVLAILFVARERAPMDERGRAAIAELSRLAGPALRAARAHREAGDRLQVTAASLASTQSLLEGSPLPTVTFDRDLVVITANDAFAELTRRSGVGVHGARLAALDLPSADDLERSLRRVLQTGSPEDLEVVRRAGDSDERRWWLVSCHAVRLGHATPIGVAASFREITVRAQLLEDVTFVSETALDLMRAATPRLVARVLANAVVARLGDWCAVHLAETSGLVPVVSVHRDRPRGRAILAVSRALAVEGAHRGPHLVARTGSADVVTAAELDARAERDPQLASALRELGRGPVLCLPIHADRAVVATVTLGRRVRASGGEWSAAELRLANTLVRAAGSALRASSTLVRSTTLAHLFVDFLHVVAREVRDPLTAIAGRVFLATHEAEPAALRVHLDAIRDSAERMRRTVDRLVAAKLPSALVARERPPVCDAAEIAREALAAVDDELRGIAVSSHLERAVRVRCDRERLRDALVALLRRAASEVPAGGVVCVRVERQSDSVVFSISDTGEGLALEDARRAFDALWTGHDVAEIGITLARAVVEAHDGEAWVESVPGSGTAYCLRLPAWNGDHVDSAA